MSLTQYVASFVSETTLDSIPDETVERAKFSLVDGFGLAVAGSLESAAARYATVCDVDELTHMWSRKTTTAGGVR